MVCCCALYAYENNIVFRKVQFCIVQNLLLHIKESMFVFFNIKFMSEQALHADIETRVW